MNWLEKLYFRLWFNSQFWIKDKKQRRPYTYMMRDFWVEHKVWGTVIFAVVTGLILWGVVWSLWFNTLWTFHVALVAHLWWGAPYKKGEQEVPEYIEK